MSERIRPMLNSYEESIMEDLDELSIMIPKTPSSWCDADRIEPLAVEDRDIEAPFLAVMVTALGELWGLLEKRQRQHEEAAAAAESPIREDYAERFPLGCTDEQWCRLLHVFADFSRWQVELARATSEPVGQAALTR
ncbi:hypothetical protein E4U32_002303 [Claviceps aff. humidiphila group G2b]|nr:hypothetical protein E4U32_002303 [Claviceps aff. humidiphila group G2b]